MKIIPLSKPLILIKNNEKAIFCPKCGNEMDKMEQNKRDLAISKATLGIVKQERFLCFGCFWAEKKLRSLRSKRLQNV